MVTVLDKSPQVDPSAWIAEGAVLAGDVRIAADVGVFYTAVIRADFGPISVGARSNIQDGCVLHTDPGLELTVGSGVSVGHRAVLHGCTVEDDVLVGMGAIVMNRAVIGHDTVVAAGTLVTEGTVIPPRSLVVGSPGKVRREVTDDELALIRLSADAYLTLAKAHAG